MVFFDTHCHLNDIAFDADREQARARAQAAGVSWMLCIGADRAGSRSAVAMTTEPGLFAAIGIHPEAASEWTLEAAAEFGGLFSSHTSLIVAYGEIGLDYHWETIPRPRQQAVFAEQIAFAASLSPTLPLIIHCRDAQDDVLAILRESNTMAPVIMHCFTGDRDAAHVVLDAGCFLGVGGVVTFKKSQSLRDAIAAAPLDRVLLETDCPYLAPQPWRGKRNEPSYLPSIAAAVAVARGVPVEAIAAATTTTARQIFGV